VTKVQNFQKQKNVKRKNEKETVEINKKILPLFVGQQPKCLGRGTGVRR
jgi:hypothetical protein